MLRVLRFCPQSRPEKNFLQSSWEASKLPITNFARVIKQIAEKQEA